MNNIQKLQVTINKIRELQKQCELEVKVCGEDFDEKA